jgi:hypothetical protein
MVDEGKGARDGERHGQQDIDDDEGDRHGGTPIRWSNSGSVLTTRTPPDGRV